MEMYVNLLSEGFGLQHKQLQSPCKLESDMFLAGRAKLKVCSSDATQHLATYREVCISTTLRFAGSITWQQEGPVDFRRP